MKPKNASKTIAMALLLAPLIAVAKPAPKEVRIPVVFRGGHDTDERDRGRPVVLIANALGVKPEIFREAFTHVSPARNGAPTRERVGSNKAALLDALSKYGITNERLDEVSDFYRYRRERGETWPSRSAQAYAVVEKGKVVKFVVTEPGAGYSAVPEASVAGVARFRADVKLAYGKTLATNGGVTAIQIVR